ncbi:hypothetical protein [Peribacillus frigoritolerans]|uniref:hypothetical protein n=1 Tax=Peribacillus frigoritolerans TaxID=450367 RepID=UPI002079E5BE|nr:hypothetical protein [Peribacillus frigoritolerans]USK76636.1 hypothetical protein LIT31_08850 [Peribacillus frigoritolerans]
MNVSISLLITIIGLFCTSTGVVLGLLTLNRNKKNDFKSSVKNDATESAIIKKKLDNIGQSVDSIRIDFKASDQRWSALLERAIQNEESLKQAHKRIDKIENKGEF